MNKLLIALTIAVSPFLAFAKPVAKIEEGNKRMVLHDTKCQLHPTGFHAIYTADGKSQKACWIEKDDIVYLLFEDGDRGVLPQEALTWLTNL